VSTYLGFAVDKIADYNSSFCTWAPGGGFIRDTFPQQSIRMAWDFCEVDPFAGVSGSWDGSVDWIRRVLQHLCNVEPPSVPTVRRGNAQAIEYPDGYFDAVVVDPRTTTPSSTATCPTSSTYGSNAASDICTRYLPNLADAQTGGNHRKPRGQEVRRIRLTRRVRIPVATGARRNGAGREARWPCNLGVRPHRRPGVGAFAPRSEGRWACRYNSWPMRSEREARSTAQISAVLSSSVVLVCRRSAAVGEGFYDDVVRELEARIADRLATFDEMQLVGADYFISAIGPAFEVFAKYARVVRLSGDEVDVGELMVLARQSVANHAIRRLLGGENISVLDAKSLMYLTGGGHTTVRPSLQTKHTN